MPRWKRAVRVLFTSRRSWRFAVTRSGMWKGRRWKRSRRHGYSAVPLSLNALSARTAALIVSLGFDRRCPQKTRAAHRAAEDLLESYCSGRSDSLSAWAWAGRSVAADAASLAKDFLRDAADLRSQRVHGAFPLRTALEKEDAHWDHSEIPGGRAMHFVSRHRVAVITAMGLAAPGALDPESFWKIVRAGRNGDQSNQAPGHLGIGVLVWG